MFFSCAFTLFANACLRELVAGQVQALDLIEPKPCGIDGTRDFLCAFVTSLHFSLLELFDAPSLDGIIQLHTRY